MIIGSKKLGSTDALKVGLSLLVFGAACYYLFREISGGLESLVELKLSINLYYLFLSLVFGVLSYFPEVVIWKSVVTTQDSGHEMCLKEISVMLYASLLLKYLPGWGWPFAAQLMWLQKNNIKKVSILYINIVSISFTVIIALYSWIIYSFFFTGFFLSYLLLGSALIAVAAANFVFINYNNKFCCYLIRVIGKVAKTGVSPMNTLSKARLMTLQFAVACGWGFAGFAVYLLAMGVGFSVGVNDILLIVISVVVSWVVGFLVVFCPGGLGVREAMMLMLLKPVLAIQAALILPILSRLVFTTAEAVIGGGALIYGLRYKPFVNLFVKPK